MVWLDTGTPHYCQLRYDGWKNGHVGPENVDLEGNQQFPAWKGDVWRFHWAAWPSRASVCPVCSVFLPQVKYVKYDCTDYNTDELNVVSIIRFRTTTINLRLTSTCSGNGGWKSELISEMREVCKDHASFRACLNLNKSFLVPNITQFSNHW